MNHFILVTTDSETIGGAVMPAIDIIHRRLKLGKWPIYDRTPCRKLFASGDKTIFYVGGSRMGSGYMIGVSSIDKVEFGLRRPLDLDGEDVLSEPASNIICFGPLKFFTVPVHLKSNLQFLDCCPKSMTKWGSILIGGARRISQHDYDFIIGSTYEDG